jgi:hypothetical protein
MATPADIPGMVTSAVALIWPAGQTPAAGVVASVTAQATAAAPSVGWVSGAIRNLIIQLLEQALSAQEFAAGGGSGSLTFQNNGIAGATGGTLTGDAAVGTDPYFLPVTFYQKAVGVAGILPASPMPFAAVQDSDGTAGATITSEGLAYSGAGAPTAMITTVTRVSQGVYDITFAVNFGLGNVLAQVTLNGTGLAIYATAAMTGASTIRITTRDAAKAVQDAGFHAVFFY